MTEKEKIEEAKNILKKLGKPIHTEVVGSRWIKGYTTTVSTEVNEAIDIILNLIKNQDTEINKLNNVIDRMVEEYEYNARINVKDFCEEQIRKDKCIQDCKTCIKEYFMKE